MADAVIFMSLEYKVLQIKWIGEKALKCVDFVADFFIKKFKFCLIKNCKYQIIFLKITIFFASGDQKHKEAFNYTWARILSEKIS